MQISNDLLSAVGFTCVCIYLIGWFIYQLLNLANSKYQLQFRGIKSHLEFLEMTKLTSFIPRIYKKCKWLDIICFTIGRNLDIREQKTNTE